MEEADTQGPKDWFKEHADKNGDGVMTLEEYLSDPNEPLLKEEL